MNKIIEYFYEKTGEKCEIEKNDNILTLKIKFTKFDIEYNELLTDDDIIHLFESKIKLLKDKGFKIYDDLRLVFSDMEDILRIRSAKKNKEFFIPVQEFVEFLNDNEITKNCFSLENILFG